MKQPRARLRELSFLLTAFLLAGLMLDPASSALGKKPKAKTEAGNDVTSQVYRLLDDSYGGKLTGFCLLGDTYKDAKDPSRTLQRILQVDYDKSRFYGRFRIVVHAVVEPTEAQLKTYTVKQLYDFGSDSEKFEKIDPGPFGGTGDTYFRVTEDGPLAIVPATDDVKSEYDTLMTQYILPALEKKQ